jgi:hypothetical protein
MSIAAAVPRIECVELAVKAISTRNRTAPFTEVTCAAARMMAVSIR